MTTATAAMSAGDVRARLQEMFELAERLSDLADPNSWDAALDAVGGLDQLGSPAMRELENALTDVRGEHGCSGFGAEELRDSLRDALAILDLAIERSGDAS